MMYHELEVGNKTYKLRINTRNIVALEKRLGCNPLSIFGDGETIPALTDMIYVLHFSLQELQHGITLEDTYNIFDAWIADGHNMTDFIKELIEIYKVSGIMRPDVKAEVETGGEDEVEGKN